MLGEGKNETLNAPNAVHRIYNLISRPSMLQERIVITSYSYVLVCTRLYKLTDRIASCGPRQTPTEFSGTIVYANLLPINSPVIGRPTLYRVAIGGVVSVLFIIASLFVWLLLGCEMCRN